MLGDQSDAADATQETLLFAVRSISRFDGRSSFSTWIYRIATNACIDELRRRRRRPLVGIGVDGDGTEETADSARGQMSGHRRPAFGRLEGDPSDAASARVDVDNALALLPLEFRTAVVLRDLCDLAYEEIAQVLEVPVGTVRSRIARGRAALADHFADAGNPTPSPDVESQVGTKEIAT